MTKKSFVLAFVPQKTGADPSKPDDRRFINTHLSRLAADRRRQGKPKLIRSQPPANTVKAAKVQISRITAKHVAAPAATLIEEPQQAGSASTSDNSNDEFTESSDGSSDELANTSTTQTLPLPVETQGFHDPFISTKIPITSQVHELLIFNSRMFQPWAVGIEKGDDKSGSFANKFAQTSLQALADKGTGYANLARLAVAAATVTNNHRLEILATRFKMLAYASLRESMATNGSEPDMLLLTQVFSLVSMETTARQDDNAALHTKTLRHLVAADPHGTVVQNKKLLGSICWHESMRCGMTGRRPILNIESFIDATPYLHTMFVLKLQLEALNLMPPQGACGFAEAGVRPDMQARLREMRFIHDLSYATQHAPQHLTEEVMEAFGYRASLVYCTLFDMFADTVEWIRAAKAKRGPGTGVDGDDDEQEGEEMGGKLYQWYTESAIALCAGYSLRAITHHEPIDVEPREYMQLYRIYSTHEVLLRHLREACGYCMKVDGLRSRQARVWLWILRVTALAERGAMFPISGDVERVLEGEFHGILVRHAAVTMGLRGWEDVEELTGGFLRMDGFSERCRGYFEMGLRRLEGE